MRRSGTWPLRLALAAALGGGAGCSGWTTAEQGAQFTVPRGAGLAAVTDTLAARGVVGSPRLFGLYARLSGAAGSLKPGVYRVEAGTSWQAILDRLVAGDVVTVRITVPEGWTLPQIAERVAQAASLPVDSVRRVLADTALVRELRLPGPTLEGYLYPATYQLPAGTPPRAIVRQMAERYRRAWTPALRARADSLGLSEREVVTLASIIEREARVWDERPRISAVYHNRLRRGMRLEADPTVQYARGEHTSRLLYADIDAVADHPYNTYRRAGLPPGPIASPSAGAIRAALYPEAVDYLFFVARPDGRHVFTRTLAEHNAAKREVRRALDARNTRE